MLPECHAHICCASFSNSSKIVLAAEISWAFSPYIDELEGSGGKGLLLCKLCYVNFPSLPPVCSVVKKCILYRRKTFLYLQPQCQLLIGSSTSLHYLLPLLSSSDFVLLVSDISCCKLNFNAASSLLQITAIQTQYIHFLFSAHAVSVLHRWILYRPLYIFK